jgi:hypothetical protein
MNTSDHCRPTYQDWLVALVMPVVETSPPSTKLVPLYWLRLMPQPVLMDDLAEQLTAPGWLDRQMALAEAKRHRVGGLPWATRQERRQAQKILERQQRAQG